MNFSILQYFWKNLKNFFTIKEPEYFRFESKKAFKIKK